MTFFKWFLVTLCLLNLILNLADTTKHGQPREPYNATRSAIAAVLNVLLGWWALSVIP